MADLTREQQKMIVEGICNGIRQDIIKKIDSEKIPEDWDGIELREYVRTLAERESIFESKFLSKKGARYQDYKNTLLVKPL
jgi:hypothetical protein